jgi:hypothetical protein
VYSSALVTIHPGSYPKSNYRRCMPKIYLFTIYT